MIKFNVPAIVLGGGINGLGIVRNLGKEGIDVYCVVDRIDPVAFSKYCRKHFVIPDFRERKDLIKSFLTEFSKQIKNRVVVFSTDDVCTLVLSDLQCEMKDDYYFVVPEREVAEKLVVKRKFYESLIRNKVPHPRVIIPTKVDDVKSVGKEFEYPIFIRPSISQYFSKVFRKKGFVANSERELTEYYHLASKHEIDVIFQEIVPGHDRNIYGVSGFFDRRSKPLALFAYRRLRGWPLMFGTNSLIESVALSKLPSLKENTIRYLAGLGYYGIMEAEFKQDPRDGIFKLLEINARSWWQNSFPTKCGLNIILKAYLYAIGEKVEYSENYTTGVKWINFLNDIRSSIWSKEIMKKGWMSSLTKVRDWAFFDNSDPLPFAFNFLCESHELLFSHRNFVQTSSHN